MKFKGFRPLGLALTGLLLVTALPAFSEEYQAAATAGARVNPAHLWDKLWEHVLIDLWVIGVVFGLVALYWLFKYKAKSPTDMGQAPKLTSLQSIAWVIIPVALFVADDFYLAAQGWTLWGIYRNVPKDAMEIKVTGHQWYWEFDYGNNVITQGELKVPVGRPVVMRMHSEDVVHDFSLPHYRVKEDVMPGRITYVWFMPDEENESVVTCTMYCGAAHSQMFGTVSAMPAEKFNTWMATASKQSNAASQPAQVAENAPKQ